ncbi:MAG: hypothetical protein OXG97_20960 [Candidatus Poribacteria bacterium]|nr:hypothetical protein [Candidatus Poribacteria bacterium]
MISKYSYLIVFSVWLGVVGCSAPNHIEFEEAFELGSFLKTHVRELPGQKVQFQILTRQGESVPFGLLKFRWVEGGRMSFQTDPNGVLRMEFEKDILDYEVMVSAEAKKSKVRVIW